MSLQRTVRQGHPAHRLGAQPVRQAHRRDPGIADRPGRHRGHRQRRHRAGPDRRDLPGPVQLRHGAAGLPVLAGPAGLRGAGQRPGHPGGERLRLRLGRLPAGRQVAAGRHREDRAGDRRGEDDARRGRRGGRGPAGRGLRHGRQGLHHRLRRAVRRRRQALREALRRPARRRARHDRGEEPPQRRGQPLRPAAQGPRRGVLPHRLGQEPDGRRAAAPHRLLPRLRRRRRRRAQHLADRRRRPLPVRLAGFGHANDFMPAERRDPTAFAATRVSWQRALAMAGVAWTTWTSPRSTTASPSPNC